MVKSALRFSADVMTLGGGEGNAAGRSTGNRR
jgi:hypothetical protein